MLKVCAKTSGSPLLTANLLAYYWEKKKKGINNSNKKSKKTCVKGRGCSGFELNVPGV